MSYKAMDNPEFEKIAEDCGLWIDMTNLTVSYNEISFYSKQLILECVKELDDLIVVSGSSDPVHIAHNKALTDAIDRIKSRFSV